MRGLRSPTCLVALAVVTAGCHVTVQFEDTRRGETRRERADTPRPIAPSLTVTTDGRFRLIEPLVCPVESVTEMDTVAVTRIGPNLATVVVGVIAVAAGAVASASGWASDDPASAPLSYLGPAAVAGGATFAIGALIGNGVEERPSGTRLVRARAGDERCGERGLAATRATLTWRGLRARSAVDADGYLALSPFSLVDAFDVGALPALALAVEIERAGGPLAVEVVIDASELARGRDGFLAGAGIDAAVVALRKVPRLEPGELRVARVGRDGQRALRLVLPVVNTGPGDAYGVRLAIGASSPELDGRVIYVGRVAAKASIEVVGEIAISDEADRALAGAVLAVTALIKDAHDTAPDAPVRFRGAVQAAPGR